MHSKSLLFVPLFFILVLQSLIFAVEPEDIDKKLHLSCLYPTINIIGPVASGSGVITRSIKIDNDNYLNFFMTCSHIVLPAYREMYFVNVYEYKDWSEISGIKKYKCFFYETDEKNDLCIGAFISEKKMYTAEVNIDPKFYIHNSVMAVGCGFRDIPRVEDGKITSPVSTFYLGSDKVRTSMSVFPGDSGCGIFMNYKVVGIAHAIKTYKGQLVFISSYFTPTNNFKKWNEDNDLSYQFVWTVEEDWPKLIYFKLKLLKDFEITK